MKVCNLFFIYIKVGAKLFEGPEEHHFEARFLTLKVLGFLKASKEPEMKILF